MQASQGADDLDLVEAVLDLLEDSREFRCAFASTRFRRIEHPRLDVAPVEQAIRQGWNVSYAKLWHLDGTLVGHRLVFAVDENPMCRRILMLGLMPRENDYDPHSEFWKRVVRDLQRHRFPCGHAGGH